MSDKLLEYNWKFCKGDIADAQETSFDDTEWRTVRVPHDYAVEGPFHPDNDKQCESVIADGIEKPIVHVARTGGLPICDAAWYRKTLFVAKDSKRVFVEFDGIMANSTIFINGKECGGRPYGYSSFSVEITKHCKFGEENLLAVHVKPENSASRWYPGAGIYRNVRLVEKQDAFFTWNPAYITTTVTGKNAEINTEITINNNGKECRLVYEIIHNNEVKATAQLVSVDVVAKQKFSLNNFVRWHIGEGELYTLNVQLYVGDKIMDSYSTRFGVRTIKFDANNGFSLNEEKIKLNGVCLHHDTGALGAALNVSAYRRQLTKMTEMGVNAIRCTHNPPAPEFLDLCDEFGVVAIDEAFDSWTIHKTANDYAKHFDKWAEIDLVGMIHRDRNHPCVIMWSLGNEILEQTVEHGWKVTKFLNDICHREDNTRPTTCGFNMPLDAFKNKLHEHIDVVGINYKPHLYEQFHKDYPNMILYGSETSSCTSSRGEYFLDATVAYPAVSRENLQVNSYDSEGPPWAYSPDREFAAQDKYDYIFGEFVWTGFDYLGEPTPYRDEWPSRSSYFGIFDLAGIEKDRYYSYKAQWTDKDVLHIFPHWNWSEGDLVDVHCYSSSGEVELFLNGKSFGTRKKDLTEPMHTHRMIWKAIPFEKGELKAVSTEKTGLFHIVKTAGEVQQILLEPERLEITADGNDLVYIRCTAIDSEGNICPKADVQIDFSVEGVGEYLASDNGDATDTRIFNEVFCNLYNGKCMVIVRSIKDKSGEIVLTASAKGLPIARCVIKAV